MAEATLSNANSNRPRREIKTRPPRPITFVIRGEEHEGRRFEDAPMLFTADFFLTCCELDEATGPARIKCLRAMVDAIQRITQLPAAVLADCTDDELKQIVSFAKSPEEDETPTPAAPGEAVQAAK